MENKKSLIGVLVALVGVVVVAALVYNALGSTQGTAVPDLSAAASTASSAATDGTDSTGAGAGAADGADATSGSGESAGAAGGSSAGSADSSAASAANQVVIEDFSFTALDGGTVKLSDFRGKPTLISYWATWCPPCNAEAPEIQKLYDKYGDQVNFVMLDATSEGRDSKEIVEEWMDENGYTYPVYLDESGEAALALQTYYLPTMYVFDKEGNLLTAFSGAVDETYGSKLIEQLLTL